MVAVPVRVAGGGPAGLLVALMLARHPELDVVVHERADGPDAWSTRSFTINLVERGQSALKTAGVLDLVRERGRVREHIENHLPDGSVEVKPWPGISHTRPTIAAALTEALHDEGLAKLRYSSGIDSVSPAPGGHGLECSLADGSRVQCSHVIGCDGKWSRVRDSIAANAGWKPTVATAPSWGVLLQVAKLPEGYHPYRVHTFYPTAEYDGVGYAILIPLPDGSGGALGFVGLFDTVLRFEPQLVPTTKQTGETRSWAEALQQGREASTDKWRAALERLLEGAFPEFASAFEGTTSAHLLPQASWIELHGTPSYSALGGRVALVGDAAHSMTSSRGEGCNMALESAVELATRVEKELKEARALRARSSGHSAMHDDDNERWIDAIQLALSRAFEEYGSTRYGPGSEVQRLSAVDSGAGTDS